MLGSQIRCIWIRAIDSIPGPKVMSAMTKKVTKSKLPKNRPDEVTWVHKTLFFAGLISVVVTYFTCLTIMKAKGYFSRDILIPYFSDIGRDSPNYYIFVLGLSIAAVFNVFIPWIIHRECTLPKLREVGQKKLFWLARAVLLFSALSCPFLPMIAIFPVNSHPDFHVLMAKGYFIFTYASHLMSMLLYYSLYHAVPNTCKWKRSVKKWSIRRAILLAIAFPYFPQNIIGTDYRYISYDEAMTRIEHTCPGITEDSLFEGTVKYPWRRRSGKALCEPYEDPLPCDEFERIPEGEPMKELRVTTLQSYAHCKISGYLITVNQPVCIFTMSLTYVTFYFDFVFARNLRPRLKVD